MALKNNLKKAFTVLLCTIALSSVSAQKTTEPIDYVSTLTGTLSKFELSTGNTYPAIALPWGMNFWVPQTGSMGDGWTYTYTADKIRGFKQTHQPSPWMNDYGQFSIMPVTGNLTFDQDRRASWFSHKSEVAKPNYYKVYLADYDITTEITPTERAAIFRFTFPETDKAYVIVDAFDRGSYVKIIPEEKKIVGYTTRNSGGVPENFKNYFVVEFDKPFTYTASVAGGMINSKSLESKDSHAGGVIGFATQRGEIVHARVASSFISPEQAELNLKELGADSFNQVAEKGRKVWNDVLGRISIEDDNTDRLRTFYSCLYRSVLFPRSFYEINEKGETVHYSPYNGQVLPGYMFTDTGFWDTFRCLFPFLNLMYPSMNEKMQEGLVNAYKESGFLPEWASPGHRNIMVGNNSASIVSDAYIKGLRGYDIETLWEALKHGANNMHPKVSASGRAGYEYYNKLGYVPDNVGWGQSAARTLEYAYDDWTIYQLGKKLNKPQSEIEIYAKRAMNYKNLYNPQYKLMTGRSDNGEFDKNFVAEDWSGAFCEGNSWHWSFCVFHDPQGLIDLMGGRKEFITMMDSVFIVPGNKGMESRGIIHEMREMQVMNMGQYAHGNQPIQHMIYLYNYAAEPWKAQYWVREVMDKLYSYSPDGYCGDEDNGQTSAWYVFSALGFYTVCPGTDQYVIGSPIFKSATLNLENGKKVIIKSNNTSSNNRYIASMKLNGKVYTKNYLTHKDLLDGASIVFDMSSVPNKQRGISQSDAPYSFSDELKR
ncbi:GH92 family glycosyl hydrolase [Dysgonomonas capnocytophagoides]|uniref:GH92 family glycosyl hydrolase n=1 Tax=Dysgonomonas capnocytophagoides TaxID=45254 RepID=UPI0033422728